MKHITENSDKQHHAAKKLCRQGVCFPVRCGPTGEPDKILSCQIKGWQEKTRTHARQYPAIEEGLIKHNEVLVRPISHGVVIFDIDDPDSLSHDTKELIQSRKKYPSFSARRKIPGKNGYHVYFKVTGDRDVLNTYDKIKIPGGEILVNCLHYCTAPNLYLGVAELPLIDVKEVQAWQRTGKGGNEPVNDSGGLCAIPGDDLVALLKRYCKDEPYTPDGFRLYCGIGHVYGIEEGLQIVMDWKAGDTDPDDEAHYRKRLEDVSRTVDGRISFGTVKYLINKRARAAGDKLPFSHYAVIGNADSDTLGKWLALKGFELCSEVRASSRFYRPIGGNLTDWTALDGDIKGVWRDAIRKECGKPLKDKKVGRLSFDRGVFDDALAGLIAASGNDNLDFFKCWLESDTVQNAAPITDYDKILLDIIDGKDNPLNRWGMRALVLSIVYLVYEPGAKWDEVIIFQGKEGIGKSTFWANLLPAKERDVFSWFTDNLEWTMTTKELIETTRRKILCEIGEMTGSTRADADRVKRFITGVEDTTRMAYREDSKDYKRQFVMVGTTNEDDFLPAHDENRRYIVIPCIRCPGYRDYDRQIANRVTGHIQTGIRRLQSGCIPGNAETS